VLGTTNDHEWQRVARDIIERPDLAEDPRLSTNPGRCAHREVVEEAIRSWCAQHDLADIQHIADAAEIGNARFNLPSDVIGHPQLADRQRWCSIGSPNGQVPVLRPPPVVAGFEPDLGAVPALGEHTDAVLRELGVTAEELTDLRARGAIGP
jgi:crotonobetainyl-CoA:carnitine CoA-transferase CaiB-like acyl-CoA transferase